MTQQFALVLIKYHYNETSFVIAAIYDSEDAALTAKDYLHSKQKALQACSKDAIGRKVAKRVKAELTPPTKPVRKNFETVELFAAAMAAYIIADEAYDDAAKKIEREEFAKAKQDLFPAWEPFRELLSNNSVDFEIRRVGATEFDTDLV